ncbi:acetate--CoA ligase family protein [Hydrogenophaga sp.]|uniref:acetate--CoA ligase family protein n=1 Tax=Hydrogenophaga sp. TaxID=1904254 RepID=UPI0027166546|nr:acetate--CoA ligase family protein [Hydrogenophaga sp.]MDO9435339.1 acetate--CoA ligase family protein [Hydrogenophaga sp.]
MDMRSTESSGRLDALFAPRSIAVVGASNDWRRFGGRVLHYLRRAEFEGELYPINPGRDEVQGLKAYADVKAVGRPFDCAVLAVTAEDTVKTIRDCAEAGVKSAIIYGAGFAEVGAEGQRRQDDVVAIAREHGMRILGPNCMGLVNARAGVYATFASAFEERFPAPGRIGIATQSGGYGGYLLQHTAMRQLGLSHFVATGNEADVDVGEAMAWMAQQDDVEIILAYLEGVRNADHLLHALDLARQAKKPVVMMKVGRTPEGRVAAASHTASLTGEDAVYDAIFREYGVYRARTTDELLDVAYALNAGKRPQGARTAVISISGGVGVQMADFLSDAQLELGKVPEATQQQLREIVPYCSPTNPIDMTGLVTANHDMLGRSLERVLESDAFDAIILFLGIVGMAPSMAGPICQALSEVSAKHPDRLLMVSVTTPPELHEVYAKAGFLVYEDPSRAVTSLAALHHYEQFFRRPAASVDAAPNFPNDLVPAHATAFNEVQAKRILAACGIRSPRESLVQTPEEAADAASQIGFPVAVKVVSADIPHKTEVGGVALRLGDAAAVRAAVARMASDIPKALPDARIEGFLVSEMVVGGTECILGVRNDPAFGPMVTFGLGGVMVELLRDVVTRPAPVSPAQALEMMQALRTWPVLSGWRGAPPGDTEAMANAIASLSQLAMAQRDRIAEIEVNPVVVCAQGKGVVALDAVIHPIHKAGQP